MSAPMLMLPVEPVAPEKMATTSAPLVVVIGWLMKTLPVATRLSVGIGPGAAVIVIGASTLMLPASGPVPVLCTLMLLPALSAASSTAASTVAPLAVGKIVPVAPLTFTCALEMTTSNGS